MGTPSAPPLTHAQSPTASATRYVDNFGDVENVSVCSPAPGPGVSETILPLEMAVSPTSMVAEIENVAFISGSSKQGNARRASVASICVVAYFRLFPRLR